MLRVIETEFLFEISTNYWNKTQTKENLTVNAIEYAFADYHKVYILLIYSIRSI